MVGRDVVVGNKGLSVVEVRYFAVVVKICLLVVGVILLSPLVLSPLFIPS